MTFKQFERFVNALDAFYARERLMDKAFEPFNSSWCIIEFCPEITNAIFDYIKEYFNDKSDVFDWWYFEAEKGTNPNLKLYDENKNEIKLTTIQEVYQYLTGD